MAAVILSGGRIEGTPQRHSQLGCPQLASARLLGLRVIVYFMTIYLHFAEGGGSFAGAAFSTMGLIILVPLIIRALQTLLREYCDRRAEEEHLAPSTIRGAFESALQRVVPVIVIVAAVILSGHALGGEHLQPQSQRPGRANL